MTAEEVETSAYTGYARLEAVSSPGTFSSGNTHGYIVLAGGNADFATFTAAKNIHSIGVYSASTGGNLLLWLPFAQTAQTGDVLTMNDVYVYFNSEEGSSYIKANSCETVSQMIICWLGNVFTTTDSLTGNYHFDEINTMSKNRRCLIIESESNTTGDYWSYPSGGTPEIGSPGAFTVKYASSVNATATKGSTVVSTPGVAGSSALCLSTKKQSGAAVRYMKATYNSAFTGLVTKVTYAIVVKPDGSPPPDHVDGDLSLSADNLFIPLAVWTPDGSDWTFVSGTTKLAFTLGMSIQREDEFVPSPTYAGSMIGITAVDPLKLTLTEGYPYEHSLVSLRLSQIGYDLVSSYNTQTYNYFDPADYSIPISAYELDPVAELVDLRRYAVDTRSGDTHVAFSVKLRTADGDIPSTTGKSVVVRYSINGGDTAEVRGSVPANYSTTGRVIFALPAVALVSAGQVRAEIALEGPGDSVQTFPYDDTIFISIMRSL